jgi:Ca2+/Na+ antiporter
MLPLIDNPSLSPLIRGVLNSITFLLSLVLLERSADVFVDSTAVVAKRLGISTVLVGLLTAGAEWEEVRSDVRAVWLTFS